MNGQEAANALRNQALELLELAATTKLRTHDSPAAEVYARYYEQALEALAENKWQTATIIEQCDALTGGVMEFEFSSVPTKSGETLQPSAAVEEPPFSPDFFLGLGNI